MQWFGLASASLWWYVFGAAFLAALITETFRPFRQLSTPLARRWLGNGVLLAASSLVIAGAYGLSGIALAAALQGSRHGTLNRLAAPAALRFALGFLALDLGQYMTHRLLHRFGILWRIHQVHHSESDLDATTGLRFHPGEALIAQATSLAVIALLGVAPAAVLAAALIALLQDLFTHANVAIPQPVERFLGVLIITPGLHRTHHSDSIAEQNMNFGTIFSLWDRLFGTYLHDPASGHCQFGLAEHQSGSSMSPASLLMLPFRNPIEPATVADCAECPTVMCTPAKS